MLSRVARAVSNRVMDPAGRALVRAGVSPDAVTVIGMLGTVAAAVWFLPRGELVAAVVALLAFGLLDLVDGAMARARGGGTKFGEVLDATCDRIGDGAMFAALAWWLIGPAGQPALGVAALICLVAGQIVSYVKARAEAVGLSADVGLAERADRLAVAGLGALLTGLGVPFALAIALWLVAAASVITVVQRLVAVRRAAGDDAADRVPR
jgi:CDP-diacylglycerol---glycerol-3-phosphate 3-phosphatidyltransferase